MEGARWWSAIRRMWIDAGNIFPGKEDYHHEAGDRTVLHGTEKAEVGMTVALICKAGMLVYGMSGLVLSW